MDGFKRVAHRCATMISFCMIDVTFSSLLVKKIPLPFAPASGLTMKTCVRCTQVSLQRGEEKEK